MFFYLRDAGGETKVNRLDVRNLTCSSLSAKCGYVARERHLPSVSLGTVLGWKSMPLRSPGPAQPGPRLPSFMSASVWDNI